MKNKFYTEFDTETLEARSPDPYRSEFQRDRDRIVHGSAFRRLQAKTQVFLTGEYDFYRTRLTHSIEVAQIGRSICRYLFTKGEDLTPEYYIDPDLVEATCLAHDIGNPPFGHAGERTLHQLMRSHGGFEGNAQSLRLITESFYGAQPPRGMKPTRAFLDAILKYKILYDATTKLPDQKFLYPEQEKYVRYVHPDEEPMAAVGVQSVECQIMDWSDDIANGIDDLKDAITAGFLTAKKIETWMEKKCGLSTQVREKLSELQRAIDERSFDRHLSIRMGYCITGTQFRPRAIPASTASNRYRYEVKSGEAVREECEAYKQLAFDVVFSTAKVQQLEHKGTVLLRKLFTAFRENYEQKEPLHLLPEDWHDYIKGHRAERERTICDFIAGMTDTFASRTFQRLYQPEYGSLADLV